MEITKVCSKCGVEKPATSEYFNKEKRSKSGLRPECKECNAQHNKEYYTTHVEAIAQHQKEYNTSHAEAITQHGKEYYTTHAEHIAQHGKEYRASHAEAIVQRGKEYCITHAEAIAQHYKEYYALNKIQIAQHQKEYRELNKDKNVQYRKEYRATHVEALAQRDKEWAKANPDKCTACAQRRRARKNNLPATFTVEQWESCKEYFNYRCAYCGRQEPLQQEHYIPVTMGGSYASYNILPSCGKCNCGKGAKIAGNWFKKQPFYTKKREQAIVDYLNRNNHGKQMTFDAVALQA